MSNSFMGPNDSTQPLSPPTPQGASPAQGKLVLGNFKDQPPPRQPYQYPSPRPYAGQGVYTPDPNRRAFPGVQGAPGGGQFPGQPPGQGYKPNKAGKAPRKRGRFYRVRRIGCITTIVLLAIVLILGVIIIPRLLTFGSAISTQPPLTLSGDMGTNNRTNLLILGYGGTGHDGAYLTDSLQVVSLLPQSRHTSLVSLPRDLWVQNPYTTQSKINAIYTVASNNNQNPADGGKAMTDIASTITGLEVKYWMTINFTGFRDLINSIGGVDVDVPNSFSAYYPVNDDPNIDANYKIITFNEGKQQHMDGETAIEYARARKPVLDPAQGIVNPAEGTDFARSARQQIIIKAAMSKIKQLTTWPKIFDALNALQDTIRTNLSMLDLVQFSLDMDLESSKTARIGLSFDNVLTEGTSDDGQSIIVPKSGDWNDWTTVASYVKQNLYN